jgi:hypothetical protein
MSHTILGSTPRNELYSLSLEERLRHIAVLGSTGMGKSTFLLSIIAQDIARGDGLLILDPHGSLAEDVLPLIPPRRRNQVCYFDMMDRAFPVGFNMLADVHTDDHSLVAEGLVSAMRAIWGEISWGPQLERILRNSAIALIQTPRTSLVHLPRLLTDDKFRSHVVAHTTNPVARQFFEGQFEAWPPDVRAQMISPVLNKLEAFIASDAIRNVLGQEKSTLHFEHAMRNGRIVVANLAKGSIGETPAYLMGALLLARAQAAAMGRVREMDLRPFHILIDEAQNFGTGIVTSLLSEARKFSCSVVIVTQYLAALDERTRAAVLGNALVVCFRLGHEDAAFLAPKYDREHQEFNPYVLKNLSRGEAWCGDTFLYPDAERVSYPGFEKVRQQSRLHYSRPRAVVEPAIERAMRGQHRKQ